MKKWVDGIQQDMAPEEIAFMAAEAARYAAQERRRPMDVWEVAALLIKQQINTLEVDGQTALRMQRYYPDWAVGMEYPVGYKVQRSGRLCRALQAHISQEGWEPENAPALWEYINETYDGTQYDPIPYNGNMALEEGRYYTQSGARYLCTRSTGKPVYNPLADLVGIYVQTA